MSSALAIATITAALRSVIDAAIHAAPNEMKGDGPIEVKTGRPTPDGRELPTKGVNIFLYQITPNAALRNIDAPTRRPDGSLATRPQMAIDLHYLLSFHGEEKALQPQRLLGVVMRTLYSRPILSRAVIDKTIDVYKTDPNLSFVAKSDVAVGQETARLTPISLSLEELAKIWSVFFQTPYSLSVAFLCSPVLIEAEDTPREAPPVRSRSVLVVSGAGPVIERVIADAGAEQAIVAGSVIRIEGRGFGGETTLAQIDGVEITPEQITRDFVRARLPASLWPGAHGVVVSLGAPGSLVSPRHPGATSNAGAFVLHPRLNSAVVTSSTATGAGSNTVYSGNVALTFDCDIGRDQRVVLSLGETTFEAAARPHGAADPAITRKVVVAVKGLRAGAYTAQARVDGVVALPGAGATNLPTVSFP